MPAPALWQTPSKLTWEKITQTEKQMQAGSRLLQCPDLTHCQLCKPYYCCKVDSRNMHPKGERWISPVSTASLSGSFLPQDHHSVKRNPILHKIKIHQKEFTSVHILFDNTMHIAASRLLRWHCNVHFQHAMKISPFVLDQRLDTEVTTSTKDCYNSWALKSPRHSFASCFDPHSLHEHE